MEIEWLVYKLSYMTKIDITQYYDNLFWGVSRYLWGRNDGNI